jgi:hypothetical protein
MSRPGLALSVLFAVTAASVAVGCITFINTDPGGLSTQNCGFKGSDSAACGACIAAKCQAQVDACCRDKLCRDDGMKALDACATGAADECDGYGLTSDLEKCIADQCGACLVPAVDGGSTTSCTGSPGQCTCTSTTKGNAQACSQTSLGPGTVCCPEERWPALNTSCACRRLGCTEGTKDCRCTWGSSGGTTKCSSKWTYCCAYYGSTTLSSCTCSNSPCPSYETPVSSCDGDNIACTNGGVASCSK